MSTPFLVVGSAFALLAALVHVMIFYLESVTWSRPATWRRFGVRSQADADVVRPMAYNQGYYNLFLATGTVVGVALIAWTDADEAGYALVLFVTLSMLAAATVLIVSSPALARAAITQGALPLLAVVFLLLAPVVG